MARIRTIKPDFFRHEGLFEAEREEGLPLRVAFAGLWTAADREGRFAWSPRALKLDCLPYNDVDFARVLDALATRAFIVKYAVDGREFGHIPSWHEHQVINNREKASAIPDPNENNRLTCAPRVDHACATPLVQGQAEGKGKEGKGRNSGRVHDATVLGERSILTDNLFADFWAAYPKREGANPKAPAKKEFVALVKSRVPADEIIAGARGYAEEQRRIGKLGTSYVAQAVTWLNQQRWQDYRPRPEDAERNADLDRQMAERGYVWADGQWQKKPNEAECLQ